MRDERNLDVVYGVRIPTAGRIGLRKFKESTQARVLTQGVEETLLVAKGSLNTLLPSPLNPHRQAAICLRETDSHPPSPKEGSAAGEETPLLLWPKEDHKTHSAKRHEGKSAGELLEKASSLLKKSPFLFLSQILSYTNIQNHLAIYEPPADDIDSQDHRAQKRWREAGAFMSSTYPELLLDSLIGEQINSFRLRRFAQWDLCDWESKHFN